MSITEAKDTTSRMDVIRKLLAKAEGASTEHERDAYLSKAAELMAKYGVDEAMLSETNHRKDEVVDRVIWTDRPFSKQMAKLLWNIAEPRGARAVTIKEHTGSQKVGQLKWRHGLRVFAFEADLRMIELMYATARTLALAGADKIKGYEQFGQDQKAHRESYIEGFADGVWQQVRRAQREATRVAEAERQQAEEQALLRGELTSGRSVALVLADRNEVVLNAFNLARHGKTTAELKAQEEANRERWAEASRRAEERWEASWRDHEECDRCRVAKSGFCNDHRWMRPSQAQERTYERVGAYYGDGLADGREADLGGRTPIGGARREIGS